MRSPAEKAWNELMEGNLRFVNGTPATKNFVSRRQEVLNQQSPRAIVFTCSDSRLSPELIFDQNLGDLFVIRTAGNVADMIALGSLEFVVGELHTPLLVVMGHEHCGGIAVSVSNEAQPTMHLQGIVDRIRPSIKASQGVASGDALLRHAEISNARKSARDVERQSPIIRRAVRSGELLVVPAIYKLASGEVVRLAPS
jgi:carbonic anhydrase